MLEHQQHDGLNDKLNCTIGLWFWLFIDQYMHSTHAAASQIRVGGMTPSSTIKIPLGPPWQAANHVR
jgi:hypothetical protein